ncbi:MAG: alpha/beta hydrolase [Prevotella sp.]|nr:alpha/beta hydrolase [Prevotella sp.]MCM1075689.1 alpha/beta hydrolase [Ruminococcus sp.]
MKRFYFIAISALLCFAVNAQSLVGTWNGKLDLGMAKLAIVFHISDEIPPVVTLDSPDQGAKGIPTTVKYCEGDSISIEVPNLLLSFQGKLVNNEIKGAFTQMGNSLHLNLTRGEVKQNRPQTPVPPFSYNVETVSFKNDEDGVTLAGTLTSPKEADKNTPIVIMVSGSGLQNRDEEIFGHKPFAVLADYLARNGVASLRYDDRGTGESTGNPENCTTADFARDAMAALQYLRGLGYSNIGILGHSEGATIAFVVTSKGKDAARPDFIVSVGAPSLSGREILLDQYRNFTPSANASTETDFLKNAAESSAWMHYFMEYNPAEDIAMAVDLPVLVIYGKNDMQVRPSINEPVMSELLANNPNAQVVVITGINHMMQPSQTGLPGEYPSIETTVAPEVLDKITDFIQTLPRK